MFPLLPAHAMAVDHYENFPVASLLLPEHLRKPVETIYRFARGADDIADEGDAADARRLGSLAQYRSQLRLVVAGDAPMPQPEGPMFEALGQVIAHHCLPAKLFEDLLDAFCQDVVQKRYRDFPQLLDYCRRSANPVGRLLLKLYGVNDPAAFEKSDLICSSLQLINFWQDVAVDLTKGRVYLPQDSLVRFGYASPDEQASVCDERFRALMDFEIARARAMLIAGAPLAQRLPGRIGWELSLVVQGGLRILEKIEAAGYDVFRMRPVLRRSDWCLMAWRAVGTRIRRSVQ